jgi:hypothetical protein
MTLLAFFVLSFLSNNIILYSSASAFSTGVRPTHCHISNKMNLINHLSLFIDETHIKVKVNKKQMYNRISGNCGLKQLK